MDTVTARRTLITTSAALHVGLLLAWDGYSLAGPATADADISSDTQTQTRALEAVRARVRLPENTVFTLSARGQDDVHGHLLSVPQEDLLGSRLLLREYPRFPNRALCGDVTLTIARVGDRAIHGTARVGERLLAAAQRIAEAAKAPCRVVLLRFIAALSQEFGERVWTSRSAKDALAVKLSCAPSAFLKLGYYGCDSSSCYRGAYATAPRFLAAVPNSFVAQLYSHSEHYGLGPARPAPGRRVPWRMRGKIVGRAWGILTSEGLLVGNFYGRSSEQARAALHAAFTQWLVPPPSEWGVASAAIRSLMATTPIYINIDTRVCVPTGKRVSEQQPLLQKALARGLKTPANPQLVELFSEWLAHP